MKQAAQLNIGNSAPQPPSGGCVLKPLPTVRCGNARCQPPSGGCVLKRWLPRKTHPKTVRPAAFGRLCVETISNNPTRYGIVNQPPSGGCVLKQQKRKRVVSHYYQPPSGGCVLKHDKGCEQGDKSSPAAFGRLCVETGIPSTYKGRFCNQPPSGGCVLKPIVGMPTLSL